MVKARILSPKPLLNEANLEDFLRSNAIKDLHGKTIIKHMTQYPQNCEITKIPELPAFAYDLLQRDFSILTSAVVEEKISTDGTIKLLIQLQDGHQVESVIMRHHGRNTLCVSSQIGCQMGCTFCATGTMGIIGDLCSGEILEQVVHANLALRNSEGITDSRISQRIRNVVFMGMGEPLNNYVAVLAAIRGLTSVFNIGPKHITLSTVGVIHRIEQLKKVNFVYPFKLAQY